MRFKLRALALLFALGLVVMPAHADVTGGTAINIHVCGTQALGNGNQPLTMNDLGQLCTNSGTNTGPITFGGSGISTGLPTNGVYLNSANQCFNASPAIGLSGKDGTPLLQFLSSSEAGLPPSDSVAIGYGNLPLWNCATAAGPVLAIGPWALNAATTANHEIAIGTRALYKDATGGNNTVIGVDSLSTAVAPITTMTFGEHTLTNAVAVSNGVYIGYGAGFNLGTTASDTALGFNAMLGLAGNVGTGNISGNTALGGYSMVSIGTSASNNTAVGLATLSSATFNGSLNVAIGHNAGDSVTTGGGNILVGASAGANLTTGSQSVFIGGQTFAGAATTSGIICIGFSAVCGGQDVVIGDHASAAMATNLSGSSVVGAYALGSTTGVHNTALGYTAGFGVTSGASNLILGYAVESNVALTGSNNVILGTSANCVLSGATAANEFDLCGGSTSVLKITGMGTPSTSTATFGGDLFGNTLNASAAGGGGSLSGSTLSFGAIPTLSRNGTGAVTISTNASDIILAPAGNVVEQSPLILKNYTVAGLPTCNAGLKYAIAAVSDATAPTYNGTLTGGGAVTVPVSCDGAAWKSH